MKKKREAEGSGASQTGGASARRSRVAGLMRVRGKARQETDRAPAVSVISRNVDLFRARSALSFQCQRLCELVSREVLLIRESGANSLAVVIRPDRHSEMFLQLQSREERIEAFVRSIRGDTTEITREWNGLREVLRHEGVELAPLWQSLSFRREEQAEAIPA